MVKDIWEIGDPVFEVDQICPMYQSWPWNGHRLFAYDLVNFIEPDLVVELGTYWGTSFFSMCQSVKDHGLSTRCVAVDTWKGDDHSGSYEDVYEIVKSRCVEFYSAVSYKLLRMYFNEAVGMVENESVNILHIDGYHTYEAVSGDFNTWLPKLAKNGVVLFHDISDNCDYGSVRFWKKLKNEYPHFEFQHSWGLGILFPKGDTVYRAMLDNNFLDKSKIYQYRSELLLAQLEINDLKRISDARQDRISDLERTIQSQTRETGNPKALVQRLIKGIGLK